VRTHPRTFFRHIAQYGIENLSGLAFVNRIDPDKHAVERHELVADLVGDIIGVDYGLGLDPERNQFLKHAAVAIVKRSRRAPRRMIAAPEDRDSVTFHVHATAAFADGL
jgi:hypothetical protein